MLYYTILLYTANGFWLHLASSLLSQCLDCRYAFEGPEAFSPMSRSEQNKDLGISSRMNMYRKCGRLVLPIS